MLSLRIALRFLKSGRTQTTLITVGIAVAISIQLFVGLLIDSLQKSLVAQTVGNSPQVTVSSSADTVTIPGWPQMLAQITQVRGIDAVSATASASAFATKGGSTLPVLVSIQPLRSMSVDVLLYNSTHSCQSLTAVPIQATSLITTSRYAAQERERSCLPPTLLATPATR